MQYVTIFFTILQYKTTSITILLFKHIVTLHYAKTQIVLVFVYRVYGNMFGLGLWGNGLLCSDIVRK